MSLKSMLLGTISGPLEVVGIVEAWGTVQVHREGFRAQYARPVSLLLIRAPRDSDYGRLVEDIAIAYRADLIEFDGAGPLLAYCGANGIGMSRETVESLITKRDPKGLRVDGRA